MPSKFWLSVLSVVLLSGCTVVTATVSVATSVVEGTVEVVDAVTPDILDSDESEND